MLDWPVWCYTSGDETPAPQMLYDLWLHRGLRWTLRYIIRQLVWYAPDPMWEIEERVRYF